MKPFLAKEKDVPSVRPSTLRNLWEKKRERRKEVFDQTSNEGSVFDQTFFQKVWVNEWIKYL